ncbi:MAG: HAMP domain-containing sensor histidine kinase, partial [Acidimicrobiia bacterium]|nr:HAMP domain-containing sensor histidine kinase [Acidimicrobiia bacterium]
MELERRIKAVALLAAVATLIATGTGWLIDPTNAIYTAGAIASAIAGVAFAVILWTDAPAVLIAVVTAPLTIVTPYFVPEQPIRTMAAVALVVIGIIGVVLCPAHWRRRYIIVGVVVIGLHTVLSGQPADTILSVGATAAVTFLLGTFTLTGVLDQTKRVHAERLDLVDMAPVFISEDDWTEAERRVRDLGIANPDELRTYLLDRRELVVEILGTVRPMHHNPALLNTFGLPSGGSRFSPDRVHEHSIGAFVEQLVAIVTDKPFHDYEYETTTKDGERIALSLRSIVNRRHPGQTRVLIVAQDITEQQKSRLALERAIKTKDEFVAGVSHELRTPLAGVVGLTGAVLERDDITSDSRELLEIVSEQANEMARIIEDLLVASRAEEQELVVELGPVDVCAEVRSVAAGTEAAVNAPESVMVEADAGRVRQVIRNLITNAARYGIPPVEITVVPGDERVCIEVADHGQPIPDGERERIFEPFQSAAAASARPAGSVGLGLAVSRVLARRMGGDLTYHHDGRSVFRLELPVHRGED